jgi:hypothetical protein
MTTSLAAPLQPTIWQNATPKAEVNDIIRKPFCPIARVVAKEVLADGRTCLIVKFSGCCDHKAEEWVLPALEVAPVPATPAVPEAIGTDGEPPNQEDIGQTPMQITAKTEDDVQTLVEKAIDEQSLPPVRVDGKLCKIVLSDHRYLTGILSGLCYLMSNSKKVYDHSLARYSTNGWELIVKTHRGSKTKCRFILINNEWQLAG